MIGCCCLIFLFLFLIGRLFTMSRIQSAFQERLEVLWLQLPSYAAFTELEDVYFAETGHGIPKGCVAGAVIATRSKPSFVISVMDRTGRCFLVHLQDACNICQKFLIEGARTSFVVLTNCVNSIDVVKKSFLSQTTQNTEIILVPSTYTRIICPMIPHYLPLSGQGLTPIISFQVPTEFIPFLMKKVGTQQVKMRTFKFPNCSIQVFGEELNAYYEKLRGHNCLLTSCTVVSIPNCEHLIIKSSRSSLMAKASCAHFRMKVIPV